MAFGFYGLVVRRVRNALAYVNYWCYSAMCLVFARVIFDTLP